MKENISLSNLCGKVLPWTIFLSVLLNFILVSFIASYIYVFLTLVGIALCFTCTIKFRRGDVAFLIFGLSYASFICFKIIDHNADFFVILGGAGLYLLFPIYWFFLFRTSTNFSIEWLINKSFPAVLIVLILALIQFYVSPDLFGALSKSTSNSIQWASDNNGDTSFMIFFRATSILSSPQVFGLFSALYLFLVGKYINIKWKGLVLLFVFFVSIHSGNKMCYVIALLFLGSYLTTKPSISKILILFTLVSMSLIVVIKYVDYENIGILYRIFTADEIYSQESEGRLKIYENLLNSYNWIMGEYPGYFSLKTDAQGKNIATESYFLLVLLENGLMFFTFFLIFLCYRVYISFHFQVRIKYLLLISILFSFTFVHAFTDPIFYIYWSFFFEPISNKKVT